ncbi:MAG TPA: hypothetical protein VL547_15960 [Dinghuibacter sp.]|uniref:right-handed parallel beta-helix repeat-containing protein n=1 Tax=Dinghuibacter sp. TaxID=2024697 RepID=UPI002B91B271|nr:hypothetical protein [Dinghuibacter sp.]HTJ13531.1 hypothetical protein [Dinghuibacter sp.]
MLRTLLALLLLAITSYARAQRVLVTTYGARPDSHKDATAAVRRALNALADGAALVFPKGRYDFWPDSASKRDWYISNTSSAEECPSKIKTIGILLENKQRVTIDGNGSTFIFHGKMTPWALEQCAHVHLRHFTVDFERPTMSEMRFLAVTPDSIVARIHPDSKYRIGGGRLEWIGEGWKPKQFFAILVDPAAGRYTYSSWDPFIHATARQIAPQTVVFRGNFKNQEYRPGTVLTVRDPIRDQVGALIDRSADVTLTGIHMQYMHGLGIVAQTSENLTYDSVYVEPGNDGRVIASFADAMHFSGCKGQITITHCRFRGMHDDPVNVHGTHLRVTRVDGDKLTVRFMHPQTYGFQQYHPGDSVAFVHATSLQLFGYARVRSARLISPTDIEVVLDRAAAAPAATLLKPGDVLENLTWTPSLTVTDCRFEGTNTRGLLVTTRRPVRIEHNVFYRTGMEAILIADDASSWYESGEVTDVLIRDNRFEECGYNGGRSAIAIRPEDHEPAPGYTVHRNVRIEDNTFSVVAYPVISARSTAALVIRDNLIRPSSAAQPFALDNCPDARVEGNH